MSSEDNDKVLETLIQLLKENEKQLNYLAYKIDNIEQISNQTHQLVTKIHQPESGERVSKRILVVDDDSKLAKSFKLILENEGHKVATANSGLSALHKLSRNSFDLVILDWNLPDMLGDELAEKIANEFNIREIIFITGYTSIESTSNKSEEFLLKPVSPEILIEAVS